MTIPLFGMPGSKSDRHSSSSQEGLEGSELDSHEKRIIQEQLEIVSSEAGYLAIYRYATPLDLAAIFISIIACSAAGTGVPLMTA